MTVLHDWAEANAPLDDERFARALWLDGLPVGNHDLYMILVRDTRLSETQFDYVYRLCLARGKTAIAEESRITRRINTDGLTDALVEEILTHCRGPMQLTLLGRQDLSVTRDTLEAFVDRGASSAVRNSARQTLNARRFRRNP